MLTALRCGRMSLMLAVHDLLWLRKFLCGILSALRSVRGVIVGFHTRILGLSATTELILKFDAATVVSRFVAKSQLPVVCPARREAILDTCY